VKRASRTGIGNRIAPPRFVAFVAISVFVAAGWLLLGGGRLADALTTGFDIAAALYLASMAPLLRSHSADKIRRHARDNDANRVWVLVLACLSVLVVLAALSGELHEAAKGDGVAITRLLATLTLAWLFANTVFAVHYAHLFYGESSNKDSDRGGLDFPGTKEPDYADFLYFSATLGMTFQTSDVAITSRAVRRVALGQCLIAFVFNLGILAFVINTLGGLA